MAIVVRGLSYRYGIGTPREVQALRAIDLDVPAGSFTVIIGHVGSGKSTLVQHFNGLIRPQEGSVRVLGVDVGQRGVNLRALRQRVGLVFQYPEHQLFADTVYNDIAFGPRNMGLEEAEIQRRVQRALEAVGLPQELSRRSPFSLSGGQRRRVAIAGVLAMNPEILILDEPAAGLDPVGRRSIYELAAGWHRQGKTVVLITHDMAVAARWAQQVVVLHQGRVLMQGPPREIFQKARELAEAGLALPDVTQLLTLLRQRGAPLRTDCLTVEEAARELIRVRGGAGAE